MAKPPLEVQEALRRFDPDVQDLAAAARAIVLDIIGPCFELIFPIQRLVSMMYSTTEKQMKDNICLLVVYRGHVNLMFPRGVDLKDPRQLLEGSGKAMRHVKMRTLEDLERPGVRQLIAQAKKRQGLGTPAEPLRKTVTSLKRRPAASTQPAWPRLF
jgi:hypothetical protein